MNIKNAGITSLVVIGIMIVILTFTDNVQYNNGKLQFVFAVSQNAILHFNSVLFLLVLTGVVVLIIIIVNVVK
jgi:hypothetical protein